MPGHGFSRTPRQGTFDLSRANDPAGETMNMDALVAPLRADVVSGAAVVSRTAAEVVRRVAIRAPASDVGELRTALGDLAVRLLDAQPAMAPLVALTSQVLASLDDVDELDEGRRAAASAAEGFRGDLEARTRKVAVRAARLLPRGGTVLTLSASSTVKATLLEVGPRDLLRVICLESRPMSEGQSLARALANAGVPVTFAIDAAAESLVASCDAVLLGADSVGDQGVVNKVGSRALARAARERGVPVWVLADTTKLLPPGFPQPVEDDRPADEVWQAPGGVTIWNRYFELIPDELVGLVVTESGEHGPDDVRDSRRRLPVPQELAAWAGWRRTGGDAPPGVGAPRPMDDSHRR
jgi:translation initiation factor eIF-2B subunit delta